MVRIAVVTPLFPTSAEPYRGSAIYETVLALQHWAEIEVFCPLPTYSRLRLLHPRQTRYSRVDPKYSPAGVRVHYIEIRCFPVLSRPFNGGNCARPLLPYLEKYRPDLILAYWIYPEGYAACAVGRKLGIPVIVGSRGSDLLGINDPFTYWMVKRTLREASLVLTVSEDLQRKAIAFHVPPERVRTVRNGCNPSVFHLAERKAARSELGVRPDAKLILFIGWIAALKGVRELLEATETLIPTHPELYLTLIGEGNLIGELKKRSGKENLAGHVHFLGRCAAPEIARWLAACNVLCLPSYTEGCPNVVLEALSCGRPVVASDVGGIPELVDSGCCVLVPPRDVRRLACALVETLQQRWDEAAIASYYRRTWEDVARETYEACCSVLHKGTVTCKDSPKRVLF